MELPNLPRNWDMLFFVLGWFSVFFGPQQNKFLMQLAWFMIITGIVLGILNYTDSEMRHGRLKLSDTETFWFFLVIFCIWIGALLGCYFLLFPRIYPNLV
jgi:hypothetical protein